jgi:cytochrome c peroxidase
MNVCQSVRTLFAASAFAVIAAPTLVHAASNDAVKQPDPAAFKQWLLPAEPPHPADNAPTPERVALGKMLFFDPRLSGDHNMSCASCHTPMLGWSDGLAFSVGFRGKPMARSSPTIINTGYNSLQMWDGRVKNLEAQVMGPMKAAPIMNADLEHFFAWMNTSEGYKTAFAKAYPGETIDERTFSKAVASYERSIVSRTSPFDRWVEGDKTAMNARQLRGMMIFMDKDKGNCAACHAAPNFTDNGFHNLGLASFGNEHPDMGRYAQKPIAVLKGAFKTPTLRDVEWTAPYFHDGSAKTLMDVVEHYAKGGEVRTNLDANMKPLNLTQADKEDLVAFLKALSSPQMKVELPILPAD